MDSLVRMRYALEKWEMREKETSSSANQQLILRLLRRWPKREVGLLTDNLKILKSFIGRTSYNDGSV